MAPSYTVRHSMPHFIVQGRPHELACPVYYEGEVVTPTSASVSVYDASNQAVVDGATATIGADGIATYVVQGATTSGLQRARGWRVEWEINLDDGTVLTPRSKAALVRTQLYCPVTDADIVARVPSLDTADGRRISGHYHYQWAIDSAWIEVSQWLLGKENLPHLVTDSSDLWPVVLYLAVSLIFADMSSTQGDSYSAQATTYRELYVEARGQVNLDYDRDDDGVADERRAAEPTLWFC